MYAYVSSLLKDGVVPFIRLGRQVCGTDLRLEIILLHTYVVMQLHIYIDIACVPQLSGSKVHSEYALNVVYIGMWLEVLRKVTCICYTTA